MFVHSVHMSHIHRKKKGGIFNGKGGVLIKKGEFQNEIPPEFEKDKHRIYADLHKNISNKWKKRGERGSFLAKILFVRISKEKIKIYVYIQEKNFFKNKLPFFPFSPF